MKSILKHFTLFLLLLSLSITQISVVNATGLSSQTASTPKEGTDDPLAITAKAAVLIENNSGRILYQKNKDKELIPASITKIMTLLLIFDAIDQKKLSLNDSVSVSEYAAKMGGSQVFLESGETQTVQTMIKCISIASANDAAVAMAERIGGSEQAFVKMMNTKAKQLGMKHTHFKNCTGLHDVEHYTCAKDLATMGAYLIKIGGKKLFSVTSLYDSYIREKNHQKFWLVNTNKLLKQYQGVDGLKTGYTKEAGYCIVTTCKKDNLRLIGVLMNEDKPQTRNEDMKGLLNYGYSKYQQIKLYSKGEVLDTLKIKDLVDQEVKVITPKDIYYLNDRASKGEVKTKIKYNQIELPVFKNQEIGELVVKKQNKTIASYSLYLEKDVKKMNFLDKLLRVYKSLI